MNSLDLIKNELITQKQILDEKGFVVNVKNINPSPSEITEAIQSINFDFSQTTADESDVKAGKTFFSKTNEVKTGTHTDADYTLATASPEDVAIGKTFYAQNDQLKTGTFDTSEIEQLKNYVGSLVCASQPSEIYIPEDSKYDTIREYAFAIYVSPENTFYKENLTIPSNIKYIKSRAFYQSGLTGKLTIPDTCEELGIGTFQYCDISEAYVGGGIIQSGSYTFGYCQQMTKLVLGTNVKTLSSYMCSTCTKLAEVELPENFEQFEATGFYKCSNVKTFKFKAPVPVTLPTGTFSYSTKASFLVPYLSYDAYSNATNYRLYKQPMFGYGEFNVGETLPSNDEAGLYSISWYTTLDDAKALTNSVTVSPSTDMLYAVFTEIAEQTTQTTTE